MISPDYRLLPEVTGSDIMEDMSTFWSWLQSGTVDTLLQEHNHDGLKADLSRMLLVGESAGESSSPIGGYPFFSILTMTALS